MTRLENTDWRSADDARLHWRAAPASLGLASIPALAREARAAHGGAVCVTGVRHADGAVLHWMESAQAAGWIATGQPRGPGQAGMRAPARVDAALSPEDTAALTSLFEEARGRGFVAADALLLAFGAWAGDLPRLSWGEAPTFAPARRGPAPRRLDLYAIVDDPDRLDAVLAAGVQTVQLRIKRPPQPDSAWARLLRTQLARGLRSAASAGAELFINDHADLAIELGARAIHLGQEDLLALGDAGRTNLLARELDLGISSHSVWELCRARALSPRYIACGPVWPTTTKDMPWVPQGLDNLAWWCRHAGAPVVAIGGILTPAQVEEAVSCGADGVCLVRALGQDPQRHVPAFQRALATERRQGEARQISAPAWPHPTLTLRDQAPHTRASP
jgi:hydroxymethylpyrimidine kinase/phosphomethylpyrimidine kinase/thiamine-phosphate diphosphorylase